MFGRVEPEAMLLLFDIKPRVRLSVLDILVMSLLFKVHLNIVLVIEAMFLFTVHK